MFTVAPSTPAAESQTNRTSMKSWASAAVLHRKKSRRLTIRSRDTFRQLSKSKLTSIPRRTNVNKCILHVYLPYSWQKSTIQTQTLMIRRQKRSLPSWLKPMRYRNSSFFSNSRDNGEFKSLSAMLQLSELISVGAE